MANQKKKLLGLIAKCVIAILFIGSWTVLGVAVAYNTIKVKVNGEINFSVNEIYADITGNVSGSRKPNNLEDISFDVNTTSFETPTSWKNLNLDFSKNKDIVVTINVKNKSNSKYIIGSVVDGIENPASVDVTRTIGGAEVNSFSMFEVKPNMTETLEVTMHLNSFEKMVNSRFSLSMTLNNVEPSNENVEYTVVDGKAEISAYTGGGSTFTIPDNINGIPTTLKAGVNESEVILPDITPGVRNRNHNTFQITAGVTLPSSIKTIVVPANIETIPSYAFYDAKITQLVLNNGVKNIGHYAFTQAQLQSLTLPNSVLRIGMEAFYESELTSLTLSENLQDIYEQAFYKAKITSLTLPVNLTLIGDGAFVKSPLETINFAENSKLLQIGKECFSSAKITKISIPEGVTRVDGQIGPFEEIEYPTTLRSFGNEGVAFNEEIKKITFRNGKVNTDLAIPAGGFRRCSNLTTFEFPDGLKYIDYGAFDYCTKLKNITLPDSIEFIGDFVFNHCSTTQNSTFKIPKNIKQLGGQFIKLDESNSNYNTQEKVDQARLKSIGDHVIYDCGNSTIQAYSLDSSNKYYVVEDGVLYKKDANGNPGMLVAYPPKKVQPNNIYTMPNTVTDAYGLSMSRTVNLDKIILSDSFVIKETTLHGSSYNRNGDWANNLQAMMYLYTSATLEVRSTNTRYYSENGAIYGKEGTQYANTLFFMPAFASTQGQTFAIKDGTTKIFDGAIPQNVVASITKLSGTVYKYTGISIPASVTFINQKSLNVLNRVQDDAGKISNYTITLNSANTAYTLVNGKLQAI